MKNVTKLFLASILMLPLSTTTSAIEVSARSGNDTAALNAAQIQFSKLEVVVQQLQDQVTNLGDELTGYKLCSEEKKFYAPDADPSLVDANNCLLQNNRSIVPGWPDVIYCSNSGSAGAAHFLDYAPNAGSYSYRTPASGGRGSTGSYINVIFNASGQVTSSTYSSCRNKTVQQLYDEGKAFNLVND